MGCLNQLYRYFDDEGALLYVGISKMAIYRAYQHQQDSVDVIWYEKVRRIEIENFKTREELERAEKLAIYKEHPIYNRKKPKYDPETHEVVEIKEGCLVNPNFLRVNDIACLLQVPETWINRYSKKKSKDMIPHRYRGRTKLFKYREVMEWVNNKQQQITV